MTFALAAVLASLQIAASCVDGATPDCSDAAICAPGSVDADGSAATSGQDASGQDADADANANGG